MAIISNIKEIFGRSDWSELRRKIYEISDSRRSVYVGKADKSAVPDRIAKHIGDLFVRSEKSSLLSKHFFDKNPDYFDWTITIYSKEEVAAFTQKSVCCVSCAEVDLYDKLMPEANNSRPSRCLKRRLRLG
jgi:hypothetical protein